MVTCSTSYSGEPNFLAVALLLFLATPMLSIGALVFSL